MLWQGKAREEFGIEPIGSDQMESWVAECVNIYQGNPCWLDEDDHIDTVNFAKSVCSETARLVMLGIGIKIDGSTRADYLQKQIERIYYQLRNWVEYGCAFGTIILKPNGDCVQLYTREEFVVTHSTDGNIDGAVFFHQKKFGDKWYTRLEYHRFEESLYVISNRCFVGNSQNDMKKLVDISATPWAELTEEAVVENLEAPLFGVFKTPQANNIDLDSPYGLPIFSEAVQELLQDSRFVLCGTSMVANMHHITMVEKDGLLFRNQRKVYLPRKACSDIRSLWYDFYFNGEGGL